MPQFKADLHIHSRFSRATSKKLNLPLLAAWARVKGIDVLATGDITHPVWRDEIRENLVFNEATGLYCLKDNVKLAQALPQFAERLNPPYPSFILQGEISSIYKRAGKVRKVHNLVFFPHLDAVDRFCQRLAQVGNLASDGRPILGLDSRDLLSMVLDADPQAFLIPAHIWTPWFSVFGSKSGFDSLEGCFGDLSGEIFALETGLSSDPEMNWTWSALDKYTLVSNSDAHSGENLAREANLFKGNISYAGMLAALRRTPKAQCEGGCEFAGTIEFFPEEGKYHTDGHRKCNVVLSPKEARDLGGICPVCGQPLTEGVSSRVLALADRDLPQKPEQSPGFTSLIPLAEILSEIAGTGPKSQKVQRQHAALILRYGSELSVLMDTPVSELSRFSAPLGEAISRMRQGKVLRQPGFDGEYGIIRVFSEEEASELQQGSRLLPSLTLNKKAVREARSTSPSHFSKDDKRHHAAGAEGALCPDSTALPQIDPSKKPAAWEADVEFNQEQEAAIKAGPHPVLVLAGPGTGKTRTLVGRIEHLVKSGVHPKRILAVTFTRRAALEMDKRLRLILQDMPATDTLHAIAFALWHKVLDAPVLLSEQDAKRTFADANPEASAAQLKEAWQAISLSREQMQPCPDEWQEFNDSYFRHKGSWNLVDYTDLLEFWLEQIENGLFTPPWEHILVDEVQDLSALQLALIKKLVCGKSSHELGAQVRNQPDLALAAKQAENLGEQLLSGRGPDRGYDRGYDRGSGRALSDGALGECSAQILGKGFFGIGDPNQAIYGFRGAYGQVETYFKEIWPELETIQLTQNYRSGADILEAAFCVLKNNQAPELTPESALNAPVSALELPSEVRLFEASGAKSEAIWIADKILELLGPTSHTLADACASTESSSLFKNTQLSPGDIAILVRLSSLAKPLADILEQKGVPVSVPEQESFWQDERVKHILHAAGLFLGIAADPGEELLDCPDRILAKGPLGVAVYLRDTPPFDSNFWQSATFNALRKAFDAYGGWAGLINWINLQNELELVRGQSEKVQIMTMHASKGLEFPVVFLACLEDGILPFAGPQFLSGHAVKDNHMDIAEENRLLYVAITRAEQGLYMSLAGKRMLYGKEVRLPKSRFLNYLPPDILRHSRGIKRIRHKAEQLSLI